MIFVVVYLICLKLSLKTEIRLIRITVFFFVVYKLAQSDRIEIWKKKNTLLKDKLLGNNYIFNEEIKMIY
jgi:hypothetical protein